MFTIQQFFATSIKRSFSETIFAKIMSEASFLYNYTYEKRQGNFVLKIDVPRQNDDILKALMQGREEIQIENEALVTASKEETARNSNRNQVFRTILYMKQRIMEMKYLKEHDQALSEQEWSPDFIQSTHGQTFIEPI